MSTTDFAAPADPTSAPAGVTVYPALQSDPASSAVTTTVAVTTTASAADAPRPAVLVLPGGGYGHYGEHEAEPVARWLAGLGMHAFVLRYPVLTPHPAPLNAARAALAWVRDGEHGLAVDASRVAVIGFSAGGHLAAHLTTDAVRDGVGPARLVLGYPVISLAHETHEGSARNLLGPDASVAERLRHSPDRLVTSAHPPTFVWHTADDGAVPLSHSLRYTAALADADVPVDLHVFAHGRHGIGLARPGVDPSPADPAVVPTDDAVEWTGLCERWFARAGWISGERLG